MLCDIEKSVRSGLKPSSHFCNLKLNIKLVFMLAWHSGKPNIKTFDEIIKLISRKLGNQNNEIGQYLTYLDTFDPLRVKTSDNTLMCYDLKAYFKNIIWVLMGVGPNYGV